MLSSLDLHRRSQGEGLNLVATILLLGRDVSLFMMLFDRYTPGYNVTRSIDAEQSDGKARDSTSDAELSKLEKV